MYIYIIIISILSHSRIDTNKNHSIKTNIDRYTIAL